MMENQEFLSLDEAVLLSNKFNLNFSKEDILYLSSLDHFKAYNNIQYVYMGDVQKPVYKIHGLKGFFKTRLETKSRLLLQELDIIRTNDSYVIDKKKEQGFSRDIWTIKERNDLKSVLYLHLSNRYDDLYFIDYGFASVTLPIYEERVKKHDIVKGMVESTMLSNIAIRNKPQNAKLFVSFLSKSLTNHYVPNSSFDIFEFNIAGIIDYPFSLEPYILSYKEKEDDDLLELYNEYNFDEIFYFKHTDLLEYFQKIIDKEEKIQKSYQYQTELITELQGRIAELEKEIESLKKSDIESSKYNPTERETHLQAIAILALRYAEQNESRLMTDTGKIKKSSIAKILKDESAELFTTPKSAETFRSRIAEAIKFYSQEAE